MPEQLQSKMKEYVSTWVNYPHIEVLPRTQEQKVFLFCDKFGNRIKSFIKAFMRLMRECGIKDATIHTMRHTYASHLVMGGCPLRTLMELLGHSDRRVTEKYAHLSDGHKQDAVKLLGCKQRSCNITTV